MRACTSGILAALLLLCASSLSSCATGMKADPVWVDGEVRTGSEQVLYQAILDGIARSRFTIGGGANKAQRTVVSNWQVELAPFRGDGFREKATVTWQRLEKSRFAVQVRVQREANQDIIKPLDVSYAEWEVRGDNGRRSHAILQRIKSIVGDDLEIGEPEDRPSFLDD
jgi:hypothetical protein